MNTTAGEACWKSATVAFSCSWSCGCGAGGIAPRLPFWAGAGAVCRAVEAAEAAGTAMPRADHDLPAKNASAAVSRTTISEENGERLMGGLLRSTDGHRLTRTDTDEESSEDEPRRPWLSVSVRARPCSPFFPLPARPLLPPPPRRLKER